MTEPRWLCGICATTRVYDNKEPCPLCARMPKFQQSLMRDFSMNHPSVFFAEISKYIIDSPLKTRLLEITMTVPQQRLEE